MRRWRVPPIVQRTLGAGGAGVLLVFLGWAALGGGDAGSTLMAFPLMSIGATLVLVSCGLGALAIHRLRRGERLSPASLAPQPLPRAVLLQRK
jgi:hypothetical protein